MKKVLGVLVALIAVLVAVIISRPASFKVERSQSISAPTDVVFAQVADFHHWKSWSPWENKDPAMKVTFEGTPGQVGSSYAWTGNDDVGAGKMTLLEANAPGSLKIKLEFLKPMKTTNQIEFRFAPADGKTRTTWTMSGDYNFMGKAFSMLMDMDKAVGADFEKGLAQLDAAAQAEAKRLAEAKAAADAAAAQAAAQAEPAADPAADPHAAPGTVVPAVAPAPAPVVKPAAAQAADDVR